MNLKGIFKKSILFLRRNLITALLIHLFIGYLTLFIAFVMVVIDRSTHTNSAWFLENFTISASELKVLNSISDDLD